MRTRSMLRSLLPMVSSVAAILKTELSGPWHKDSLYVVQSVVNGLQRGGNLKDRQHEKAEHHCVHQAQQHPPDLQKKRKLLDVKKFLICFTCNTMQRLNTSNEIPIVCWAGDGNIEKLFFTVYVLLLTNGTAQVDCVHTSTQSTPAGTGESSLTRMERWDATPLLVVFLTSGWD